MAADSPRPHPRHGVQNPACSSLSAFPALLALLRLSRLNCLHTGRVLRLEFYALPCGVLPSMPLVVWHAKPGAFLPSHPVPVSASVKQTTTEGQCGQVLGRPIPCSVVRRERIQSLTRPQRGLSSSTAWSDSLPWQGPVPGLEHRIARLDGLIL